MIQTTWKEACENMIVISDFLKICLKIAEKIHNPAVKEESKLLKTMLRRKIK